MVWFASLFRPKIVLIEQVKGLLTARGHAEEKGEVFEMLISDPEKLGYIPKWQVFNSASYGVSQQRQRVAIVETQKPSGFQFPKPIHRASGQHPSLFPFHPCVGIGTAISGLGAPSAKNGKQ